MAFVASFQLWTHISLQDSVFLPATAILVLALVLYLAVAPANISLA